MGAPQQLPAVGDVFPHFSHLYCAMIPHLLSLEVFSRDHVHQTGFAIWTHGVDATYLPATRCPVAGISSCTGRPSASRSPRSSSPSGAGRSGLGTSRSGSCRSSRRMRGAGPGALRPFPRLPRSARPMGSSVLVTVKRRRLLSTDPDSYPSLKYPKILLFGSSDSNRHRPAGPLYLGPIGKPLQTQLAWPSGMPCDRA